MATSPHKGYGILGAPHVRLGAAGIIACIGIGMNARALPRQQLMKYVYWLIVVLSVISLLYSLLRFHTLVRIGGVFSQADLFAAMEGFGLVLGVSMFRIVPGKKAYLGASQSMLTILLVLTQTRAVIGVVLIMLVVWQLRNHSKTFALVGCSLIIAGIVAIGSAHAFGATRLANPTYAVESVRYRFALQEEAASRIKSKPLFGYGTGNLADALACPRLSDAALLKTCKQGYFFNSSHNIFLDRFLTIGVLGGCAFAVLVFLAIRKGVTETVDSLTLGLCLILLAAYYFTNVTGIVIEMLLWISVLTILPSASSETDISRASA
jgi:O-antigen ligase